MAPCAAGTGKAGVPMLDVVNETGPAQQTGLVSTVVAIIVYVALLGVLVGYLLWKLPRGDDKPDGEDRTED